MARLSLAAGHFDSGPAPVPITALFKPSPKKKKRRRRHLQLLRASRASTAPTSTLQRWPNCRRPCARTWRDKCASGEGSRRSGAAASAVRSRAADRRAPHAAAKRRPIPEGVRVAEDHGLPPADLRAAPTPAAALDQILATGFGPTRGSRAVDAAGGDAQRAIVHSCWGAHVGDVPGVNDAVRYRCFEQCTSPARMARTCERLKRILFDHPPVAGLSRMGRTHRRPRRTGKSVDREERNAPLTQSLTAVS